MGYLPIAAICIDYETVELLPDGSTVASTEAYRTNFRVSSMATTERVNGQLISNFYEGEEACRAILTALQGRPLISFNAQFEMLVSMCRFPELKLNWQIDSMRLAQCYDNGGRDDDFLFIPLDPDLVTDENDVEKPKAKRISLSGFGLAKCSQRILQLPDHKREAYKWLLDNNVCKKGQEGAHLHALPYDILKRYNVADTETTLLLAEYCVNEFNRMGYDWSVDHRLYINACRRLAKAKILGVKANTQQLSNTSIYNRAQMDDISKRFAEEMAEPIKAVERNLLLKRIKKYKRLKSAKKYLRGTKRYTECKFKPGSTKQLADLFCNQLGIEAFFKTPKDGPSFKSSHLHSYGLGGEILVARKQHQLVATQAEALLLKTAYDQRWHVDLKAASTRTGRFSGGGGCNIQGLARRNKELMGSLIADDGYVFISSDASAGEPSIITQLTKDPMYKYYCFDGVGKEPFYKDDVLYIDDIYLGYASVCPMFKDEMLRVFDTFRHDGSTFSQQWLVDAEVCKKTLKNLRKNAKWITLAMGYGLGPRGLYNKAIEAGLKVTLAMCKQAYYAYWDLFKGIKQYCEQLEERVERTGWLQNPFGYRFVPTELRKSFNGEVQSTVSGLFHWYCDLIEIEAPYVDYITTIHDETIYRCPVDRVTDFKAAQDRVAAHINAELQWNVDLRFGFAAGSNLYDAK